MTEDQNLSYSTGPQWSPNGALPGQLNDADRLAHTQAQGQDLIGLPLDEAVFRATSDGLSVRLAREDGTDYILTMDLNFGRINLDVVDGRVVAASAG